MKKISYSRWIRWLMTYRDKGIVISRGLVSHRRDTYGDYIVAGKILKGEEKTSVPLLALIYYYSEYMEDVLEVRYDRDNHGLDVTIKLPDK